MVRTRRLLPPLSRRSFLRYTAVTTGLLTLSRLRLVSAQASPAARPGLQVLSAYQADVFTAITERMVYAGHDGRPAVRDTGAIETIDQALLQLDRSVQTQLRWLLIAFQWGPPLLLLKMKSFTAMSADEQDTYIRGWATSASDIRKLAFHALKNLAMLGYYSQDATWPAIHYSGPWVPRPRRVLSAE